MAFVKSLTVGHRVALTMTLLNEADKNLEQQLQSIKDQTRPPDEVIICDGGSTDNTLEILRHWQRSGGLPFEVKIIRKAGTNISQGRNAAIAVAHADIIAVTDGSCLLDKHWLEEIVKPLELEDSAYGIVFGDTKALGSSKVGRLFAALHFMRTHTNAKSSTEFSSRSVAFTKAVWSSVGGYPEWLSLAGEDTLFFLNVMKIANHSTTDRAFVYWQHGAETLSGVYKMHKRNSIGSGEALMNPLSYLIMFAIYAAGAAGLALFALSRVIALCAAFGLLVLWSRQSYPVYLRTKSRLSFLLLPAIVAVRDLGMMWGFLIGLKRRMMRWLGTKRGTYSVLLSVNAIYILCALIGRHGSVAASNLGVLFGVIATLFLPGFLLLKLLKVRTTAASETLVFSVGLSLFTLLMSGLAVNTLLPFAGIAHPLSWVYVLPLVSGLNFVGLYLCHVRSCNLRLAFSAAKSSGLQKLMILLPILFLAASVLGAISLNNGGSDFLTLLVLTSIGGYIALLLCLKERIKTPVYPFALYMICLSLLLMVSLRGWVLSGHDVLEEYSVFELTKEHLRWNIGYLNDAYNACLSITLLPTMISGLMPRIPDQYILRLVFQALFALSPVALFHFAQRYLNRYYAFLAVLLFMTQSPFLRDFPFLTRQEIGTLFFILMLLAFSKMDITRHKATIMGLFFGLSMIVSHYSTTYVAISLLSFALLLRSGVYRAVTVWLSGVFRKDIQAFRHRYGSDAKRIILSVKSQANLRAVTFSWLPTGKFVLLLVALAFAWNTWLTHTSNNLSSFAKAAATTSFNSSQFSGIEEQLKGPADEQTNSKLINSYVTKAGVGGTNTNSAAHYASPVYRAYKPDISVPFDLSPRVKPQYAQNIYAVGTLIQTALKLLLIVGVGFIVLTAGRTKALNRDFKLLSIAALLVLIVALVIPAVTQYYDVFRTYQQLLVVLAIPAVIGSAVVFDTLFKHRGYYFTVGFFVLYYLFVSPVVPQLVGSGYAQLQLNNYGLYYNLYYTHQTEYASIQWLSEHDNNSQPVYADWFATKKIDAFSTKQLWVIDNVLPANVTANSYVYEDYTNTQLGAAYTDYKSVELNYRFPTDFMNEHKNVIYSNGTTEILK